MTTSLLNRFAPYRDWLNRTLSTDFLLLLTRLAIASVFWLSGRTKVTGLLTIKASTYDLFRDEYKVPFLPTELSAVLATYAEHLLPLLLIFGLCTRLSALGLLGMTLVIQVFVYPDAWSVHLTWAALLLWLIAKGGGQWSLDTRLLRV